MLALITYSLLCLAICVGVMRFVAATGRRRDRSDRGDAPEPRADRTMPQAQAQAQAQAPGPGPGRGQRAPLFSWSPAWSQGDHARLTPEGTARGRV